MQTQSETEAQREYARRFLSKNEVAQKSYRYFLAAKEFLALHHAENYNKQPVMLLVMTAILLILTSMTISSPSAFNYPEDETDDK